MVSLKPLLCTAVCFVASVLAVSETSTSDFSLYAYGTGIGGRKLYYSDGGLYIGSAPSDVSTVSSINFTSPTTDLSTTASLTVSAATADIVGEFLAINLNSNAPATIVPGSSSSSYTTTGFLFFTGVLVWQSSAGAMKSTFYAKPIDSGSYQIYWYSDVSLAAKGDVPLSLKSVAPATASKSTKKK